VEAKPAPVEVQAVWAVDSREENVRHAVAIDVAQRHAGAIEEDVVGEGAGVGEEVGEGDAGCGMGEAREEG
jgi:hypothetical protein